MRKSNESYLRSGVHYDLLHRDQGDDVKFYCDQARRFGAPILELCCGTGRVTIPIVQSGLSITGLELETSMLSEARRKSLACNLEIDWQLGDATDFDLGRTFQLIIVPFNSVQLFGGRSRIRSFFRCAKAHLQKDGALVFDIFNPNVELLAPALKKRRHDGSFVDPDTGESVEIEWGNVYDDAEQISHVTYYYSTARHPDFAVAHLDQRCLFPQEIDLWVESCGFQLEQKLGDFSGKPFEAGDPTQILICRT